MKRLAISGNMFRLMDGGAAYYAKADKHDRPQKSRRGPSEDDGGEEKDGDAS